MALDDWLERTLGPDAEGPPPGLPRFFEEGLESAVGAYEGPHAEEVGLGPDLYLTLSHLMEDGRVGIGPRGKICRALAYFILHFDVLPEELYGAEGFIDDVYVCLWVLDRLGEELPENVLEDAWVGEGTLAGTVDEFLPRLEEALGAAERSKILGYVGLGEGG